MKITTIIVDDEPWARKRIAALLASEPDIELAGECCNGSEAVSMIRKITPDLVFLDVQMPDCDGFDVLETIGVQHTPVLIFATAYDTYALRAFDANAVDYLLKPFDDDRFGRALERARKELRSGPAGGQIKLRTLLESVRGVNKYLRRLVVKSEGRVTFLKTADVDWFEASGNYVTLHIGSSVSLIRETMNRLEPKLDPDQFVRIHRCAIVNLDRVKELQPWFHGEQVLVLDSGKELSVGRAFRDRLRRLLENAVE
jgi:two-component system, LytTR family, response regulator